MPNNLEKFSAPKQSRMRQIDEGLQDYQDAKLDEEKDKKARKEEERARLIKKYKDILSNKLENTAEFIAKNGEDFADNVYEWYKKAIERRGRSALHSDSFKQHFFEGGSFDPTYMFGDIRRGYLLGFVKSSVFIPTHFAPQSLRKGYELMKELGGSRDIPAVLAITEDLIKTIEKMPEWKVIDFSFESPFRSGLEKKYIAHNNHPDIEKLLGILLDEYLRGYDDGYDNDNSDYDNTDYDNYYEDDRNVA